MASLRFIMDFNDDESQAPHNKRDQGANKAASAGPLHEPPSSPQAKPRPVSSPVLATEQDINQAPPAAQTKRCRGSPPGPEPAATTSGADPDVAAAIPPSSSSRPLSSSSLPQSDPCRSRTSTGTMDQTRYASTVPSPSLGGRLQRPMPLRPPAAQLPPRITPKTGRVSKAQKGLPVHVCNICTPPKVRSTLADSFLCLLTAP